MSQVHTSGKFFNEYDEYNKKDTEVHLEYDEEDSFENMDISENLHYSGKKHQKDSLVPDSIPDEQQDYDASSGGSDPDPNSQSIERGISPQIRKK